MGVGLLRAYVLAPCAEENTLQDINTTAVDSCSVQRTEKLCRTTIKTILRFMGKTMQK